MNPKIIIKTAKTKVPQILIPKLKELTGLPVLSITDALEYKYDCMVECSKKELIEFIHNIIFVKTSS